MKCTKRTPAKGVIMLKPKTLDSASNRPRNINLMLRNSDSINTQVPRWKQVMSLFDYERDPLLVSVLSRAKDRGFDEASKKITLSFENQYAFFDTFIEQTITHLWKPLIEKIYGEVKRIEIIFEEPRHE